jgi:general stress protein YciG
MTTNKRKQKLTKERKEHYAAIGAKGGAKSGAAKNRGNAEHYRKLNAMRKTRAGGNTNTEPV